MLFQARTTSLKLNPSSAELLATYSLVVAFTILEQEHWVASALIAFKMTLIFIDIWILTV